MLFKGRHRRRTARFSCRGTETLEGRQLLAGLVSGWVWNDADQDGQRGATTLEYGVADVTVRLLTDRGSIADATTTDALGRYTFRDVVPDDYAVEFIAPASTGFVVIGTSDVRENGRTKVYKVREGEVQDGVDAGLFATMPPRDIQGRVWNDVNANGVIDPGEQMFSFAEVQVENAQDRKLFSFVTDASGAFFYPGTQMLPGDYQLDFVRPKNDYEYSMLPLDPSTPASVANSIARTNGKTALFYLEPNDDDQPLIRNGGFHLRSGIFGQVGTLQYPATDIVVELRDASQRRIATTLSSERGDYFFDQLEFNTDYYLHFPGDSTIGFTTPTTRGPIRLTNDTPRAIAEATIVFPTTGTADMIGRVWEDLDADGWLDPDEHAVANVPVTLMNSGFMPLQQIITDADGNYSFPGAEILPGSYLLAFPVEVEAGWHVSPRVIGTANDWGTNDVFPGKDQTAMFMLSAHTNNVRPSVRHDAAIFTDALIRAQLWDDLDGNGLQAEGELPVEAKQVRLVNNQGEEVAAIATGPNGIAQFNVFPDSYTLYVPKIDGVTLPPNRFVAEGDQWRTEIEVFSRSTSTVDAPFHGQGAATQVSGRVWSDESGDGIRQDSEPFYAGIVVILTNAVGELQQVTSDEQGRYDFTGIAPGNYHITASLPSNQYISPFQVGTDRSRDNDINRWLGRTPTFSMISGEHNRAIDIGIYLGPTSNDAINSLRVTEVGFIGHGKPEFTEVKNVGSQPISLSGVRFSNGIRFNFDKSNGKVLFPDEHTIVVGNRNSLAQRFNVETLNIAGKYDGDLNREERLTILDEKDRVVTSFHYDDDWFIIMDNEYLPWTLTVLDEHADETSWDTPRNWRPSSILAGTPGSADPRTLPDPGAVLINEVLPKAVDGYNDLIELHNTTDADIDIGYWYLGDSDNVVDRLYYLTRFQIAPGTILPAHGYLVFSRANDFGNAANPGTSFPFGLTSQGEAVHLIAADKFGRMQGYSNSVYFDATRKGVTFGQLDTSDGGKEFVALATSSIGSENTSQPLIGPIVIDQIMYHADNEADDYLRIVNISSETVKLSQGDHQWKITGGISLAFSPGDQLLPGQHAFLTATTPAEFRAHFGVPASVPVFGPYAGKLSDTSDQLRIYDTRSDGRQILSDEVNYRNVTPWPLTATQANVPMTRRSWQWLGNDPNNWSSAAMMPDKHVGNGAFARQFAPIQDAVALKAHYLGYALEIAVAGDANGDGLFNSRDLVQVFQVGRYETDAIADWLAGDWNHDDRFNSSDLVTAFTAASYVA